MDLCKTSANICQFECESTNGLIICKCPEGYELSDDKLKCLGLLKNNKQVRILFDNLFRYR